MERRAVAIDDLLMRIRRDTGTAAACIGANDRGVALVTSKQMVIGIDRLMDTTGRMREVPTHAAESGS